MKGSKTIAVALLAWSVAGLAAAEEVDTSAHDLVQRTSEDLLTLIEESRSYVKEDPERFYNAVEALLSPVIDFKGFARRVMSVHYRKATDEQRERFAENFKWGLVRTYALTLTEFKNGRILVLPPDGPPRNPKRRNVKMEIHTSGDVYPVVYTMSLNKAGEWRIGNIVIAGVNMGLTYRSQFVSAAADNKYRGNLDQVIDAWAAVVAADDEDASETGSGP
ncbi:MAG: ABC transporter substrate-binding protein [Gammaproteobacteria bacterium]|nr:ABC transporter substrate-binding protein [Gammaproteobacteria bacterium]